MIPAKREQLRMAVRFFYDLQKLRVQTGNRTTEDTEPTLADVNLVFLAKMEDDLNGLEKMALKEVTRLIKDEEVFKQFFAVRPEQKGCGPTMAGLIMAEFNIENCHTVSQMWAWAGLAVRDGQADRRMKGQKAKFDPWLKSKMVKVLGECLIKANSPWRSFYDNYKHRKVNTLIDQCMGCHGQGRVTLEEGGKVRCTNCSGTGGPAPWGASDGHRHNAAKRYMVKMFLAKLYNVWRAAEGLPIRPTYAEEYLNRPHHESVDGGAPFVAPVDPNDMSDAEVSAAVAAELSNDS